MKVMILLKVVINTVTTKAPFQQMSNTYEIDKIMIAETQKRCALIN